MSEPTLVQKRLSKRRLLLNVSLPALAIGMLGGGAMPEPIASFLMPVAEARGENPCAPAARGENPCAPAARGENPCAPAGRGENPCAPAGRGENPCAPARR
jgi:hypothetical protein